MFGITSSPEKYQQVIQQLLTYSSGTSNISDDMIIYGPYYGRNRAEYDKRLEKELTRFIMGLVLSQKGIGLTEEKVKAVTQGRESHNALEVKIFFWPGT